MAETRSTGRSLLKPVVSGVLLILAIVAAIYLRGPLWELVTRVGGSSRDWLTEWVPHHSGATTAIGVFGVVALAINWLAHVRGRLRAWIFAIVVEIGLWLLFWYGLLIPSFNDLFGLHIEKITPNEVLLSGAIVIALAGLIFWFLEAQEEWRKYRRQHTAEE